MVMVTVMVMVRKMKIEIKNGNGHGNSNVMVVVNGKDIDLIKYQMDLRAWILWSKPANTRDVTRPEKSVQETHELLCKCF